MLMFVTELLPRFSLIGQVVLVQNITVPLVYIFLPLLAGLITFRERCLGAILFLLLPLLPTLVGISDRWRMDSVIYPFNFGEYFMFALYSIPAFLMGLFGGRIGKFIPKLG